MSGGFSAGGLISGLDSNTIIRQLIQAERPPITRMEDRIMALQTQQKALRDVRGTLTTLKNRAQDFKLGTIFNSFTTDTSDEKVVSAKASSSNPVSGSFTIDVTKLASSTVGVSSANIGAAVNPAVALNSSGMTQKITAGTFSINGVTFNVDGDTQSLNDVIASINGSAAGVTASYNATTDKLVLTNTTVGNGNIINLGAEDDTSDFLSLSGLLGATQAADGSNTTSASSTGRLGAVNTANKINTLNLRGGAMTSESFTINGVTISVDPTTDAISDVIARINNSDAGVKVSYDATTDGLRVVSKTMGSRTINFGGGGTNNFLKAVGLDSASVVQTAGADAQFTVNGGAVQSRTTNEVTDAISGVTINLLSKGVSSITVSADQDAIIKGIKDFLDAYNAAATSLRDMTGTEGDLRGDSTLSSIDSMLRTTLFSPVSGSTGKYQALVDIGISTGTEFDAAAVQTLKLDEDKFREALLDSPDSVKSLFTNTAATGLADVVNNYLDEVTRATGILNSRAKANGTIDTQIKAINERIARAEERLAMHETRLRKQFTSLETSSASMQQQSSALSRLGAGF